MIELAHQRNRAGACLPEQDAALTPGSYSMARRSPRDCVAFGLREPGSARLLILADPPRCRWTEVVTIVTADLPVGAVHARC